MRTMTAAISVLALTVIFVSTMSARPKKRTYRPILSDFRIHVPNSGSDRPLDLPRRSPAAVVDTFVLAEFTFDTAGGGPDPEGWYAADLTAQRDTFFHVDDFSGLGGGDFGRLTPLEGSQSMWCGARPSTTDPVVCLYDELPGYGNSWEQYFESAGLPVAGDATFSYKVRWDSEAGYDVTYIEYLGTGGLWQALPADGGTGFYDGVGELTESFVIPAAAVGDTLWLRFRFESDGALSDEDGILNTDGAVIIDSLTVSDSTGVVDYQDFESEAPGDLATSDGDWAARVPAPYGDFSGLFSGVTVLQEDPCARNTSYLWAFFEGSPYDYSCGGHPEQPVVPYGEMREGRELYLANEIWSPLIDWNHDIHGTPIPATASEAWYELDVYANQPLDALVGWYWHIRSWTGGCPDIWRDIAFINFGDLDRWWRYVDPVGQLVDPGTEFVQLALVCWDMCGVWCGYYGTGSCHTQGPLFDNVRLIRVNTTGPQWDVPEVFQFQDNFAEDGTVTGTVRIDMAVDINPDNNPIIRPGDSLIVRVGEPNVGLDNHLSGDPSSGPAVYCHVKDVSPAKSGPAITDDPGRWPVVASGAGWTVLRFDTVFSGGVYPQSGNYCVDLNDDLYTPGDTIYYYHSARDANGNTTYWSLLAGITDDEADTKAMPMEVTCLPANALSGATDILYVDDFDNRGAQPFFENAFAVLGLTPDRYDVVAPAQLLGNSPGGRVKDPFIQINPWYRKIIWNSGNLREGLIGDGTRDFGYTDREKADDFAVLRILLHRSRKSPGLYISGDNIAEEWVTLPGTNAVTVRNLYMNFDLLGGDHVAAGEPVAPVVIGQAGSCFDHPAGVDSLIAYAYGPCPVINDFDVLTPTGAASLEMAYSNNPAHGAVLSQVRQNAEGDTARVVLSGFSFHAIRDDRVQVPADRIEHLLDILRWLENEIDDPTGTDPTMALRNSLAQNCPNPFNPATAIRYTIAGEGHVSLRVYNVAGQLVRTLVDERQAPRVEGFTRTWDGRNGAGEPVASGVYFYRLVTADFVKTKKMLLLK